MYKRRHYYSFKKLGQSSELGYPNNSKYSKLLGEETRQQTSGKAARNVEAHFLSGYSQSMDQFILIHSSPPLPNHHLLMFVNNDSPGYKYKTTAPIPRYKAKSDFLLIHPID